MTDKTCTVCGFEMEEGPCEWHICPCCGTEFEYDNVDSTIEQLRRRWIRNGMKWWSTIDPVPEHWNPIMQLNRVA